MYEVNKWTESSNKYTHFLRYDLAPQTGYKIWCQEFSGINYFVYLNDKFRDYRNFLDLENVDVLKNKIKIIEFTFQTSYNNYHLFKTRIYSKLHSPAFGEPEIFQVFDLSKDGKNLEWKFSLKEEIEFYVNLCKKQVEIWESKK